MRSLLPLLVGEAPSRSTDGEEPFRGRSGRRLEELLGVGRGELELHFRLRNLLPDWPGPERDGGKGSAFPWEKAAAGAMHLLSQDDVGSRGVILAGERVEKAFVWGAERFYGLPAAKEQREFLAWTNPWSGTARGDVRVAVFPHPSGVSRWWNEPGRVEQARAFLRAAAGRP